MSRSALFLTNKGLGAQGNRTTFSRGQNGPLKRLWARTLAKTSSSMSLGVLILQIGTTSPWEHETQELLHPDKLCGHIFAGRSPHTEEKDGEPRDPSKPFRVPQVWAGTCI